MLSLWGFNFYYNGDKLCSGHLRIFFSLTIGYYFLKRVYIRFFSYLVNLCEFSFFMLLICKISLYVLDMSHLSSNVLQIFYPRLWIIISLS